MIGARISRIFWNSCSNEQFLQSDPAARKDFLAEMRRFLPPAVVGESLEQVSSGPILSVLLTEEGEKVRREA